MRIARHQHVFILLALLDKFVEQHLHAVSHLHQFVAGKQFEVNQYLIVARTARMDLLAHIAQLTRQHQLHLRMDVLNPILNHELSAFADLIDVLQFCQQQRQLVLAYQPDTFQHRNMSHGAQHIVLPQIEVHFTISAHGEALNLGIHLKVLLPKFVCHSSSFRYIVITL